MIELDKYINNYLELYLVDYFENIHPNIVTSIGIILNFVCLNFYYKKNKHLTSCLLLIRIVIDNLDGMIARKFNKITVLGGLLDGMSDCILLMLITYVITENLNLEYKIHITILFGIVMIIYLYYNDSLIDHTNFTNNNNLLHKVPLIIYKNTYLSIIIIIILMYLSP